MQEATAAIDRLFSHLGTILRYFAPGFAALFVVLVIFPGSRPFLLSGSPPVVVLGMLLGVAIYGVHTGAVIRLLWVPLIIFFYKIFHWQNPLLAYKTMFQLDEQRWLRRVSKGGEIGAIQSQMDHWAAMLNFLYCLSYAMILIPFGDKIYPLWCVSSYRDIVLLGGFVVLVAALISEIFIISKEIRLTQQYPKWPNPR